MRTKTLSINKQYITDDLINHIKNQKILIGLSGGPDSTYMLLMLHSISKKYNIECHGIYINHNYRSQHEIQKEFKQISDLCQELDIPLYYEQIHKPTHKPVRQTWEEYFSKQRYKLYKKTSKQIGCTVIAVGHTADDLVETYMMHLIRGSSLYGLAFPFINYIDNIKIVRPIWNVPKTEIIKFLNNNNIPYSIDHTNNSLQFTRNKIRHILLPIVERKFNPQARKNIFNAALLNTEVVEYISNKVNKKLKYYIKLTGDKYILPTDRIKKLPKCLQRAIIYEWLRSYCHHPHAVASVIINQILKNIHKNSSTYVMLKGDKKIFHHKNRLYYQK